MRLVHVPREGISGLLIQVYNLLNRFLKRFVGAPDTLNHFVVVVFGESVKMVCKNLMRQRHRRSLRFAFQLLEKALLQVSACYSGRIKLLDLTYYILHLCVRDGDLLLEHQVVHQLLGCPSQVAVVIDVA